MRKKKSRMKSLEELVRKAILSIRHPMKAREISARIQDTLSEDQRYLMVGVHVFQGDGDVWFIQIIDPAMKLEKQFMCRVKNIQDLHFPSRSFSSSKTSPDVPSPKGITAKEYLDYLKKRYAKKELDN